MRIVAHRGSRIHAPENSHSALISAYVAGADVLEFDLQLTKDGKLVLSHDGDTQRVTGTAYTIIEKSLADLKKLDWSETYVPPDSPSFEYFTKPERLLAPLVFPDVLGRLPEEVELLLELKHDSSLTTGRRDEFVTAAANGILMYDAAARTVVYSKDPENLKAIRTRLPGIRIAAFDYEKSPEDQLALLSETKADGLVTALEDVYRDGELTAFGKALKKAYTEGKLAVGAVLYPKRKPGIFTREEYEALREEEFVWSISTDSMLQARALVAREAVLIDETFPGTTLDRDNWAFGYAKANKFAEVKVNDGVHLVIDKYNVPFPPDSGNPMEERLRDIENKLLFTAKDWPYYSGGGVGYTQGIRGDFSAEVEYRVKEVGQATTLEMAVLNVDPGAHVGHRPRSFRDKDSFYDPHGAPPYVGVEHDEDDGFRINWNLGSEYDNNQYGRPVGDGKARGAKLRLERRGPYFAAFMREAVDASEASLGPNEWVCVGVARNDSLNPVVYLRCVGKRWRQENEANPSEYMPILANHFTFRRVTIRRHFFP